MRLHLNPHAAMRIDHSIRVNPYGLTVAAVCVLGLVYLLFGSVSFGGGTAAKR